MACCGDGPGEIEGSGEVEEGSGDQQWMEDVQSRAQVPRRWHLSGVLAGRPDEEEAEEGDGGEEEGLAGTEGVESGAVARKQLLVLGIVATDRTFAATMLDGARAWVGKCIHCTAKLVVSDSGQPMGVATIEHIWPQNLGGTNELVNLALACARCNREKGQRHDHKHAKDPRLLEIVERLRARRRERWREPDEVGLEKKIAAVYPPAGERRADSEDGDEDDEG